MKNILFFTILFISSTAFAQADTSIVKFVNPPFLSSPGGYSHSGEIDLGNSKMILISGQVALDSKGNVVGKDDFKKQAEQVFLNIKDIVENAGGTMDNIVKTGIFLVDISQVSTFRHIRNKFINIKSPPTSTLVQVSKLFRDDLLLEIEATAIIPKK
ncbi:MAG: RidA family protein [Chitinophagaceae bacterium]|nr:RidA family protein [Chitinophagaceae bacterium]